MNGIEYLAHYEAWHRGRHPHDREHILNSFQLAHQREDDFDSEVRIVWHDQFSPILTGPGTVQCDNSRKPIRMIRIIGISPPERKRRTKLRDSQLLLTSSVGNNPPMIFVTETKDLDFVLCNKPGGAIRRKFRSTLIGKKDDIFFTISEADFFTNHLIVQSSQQLCDL